MSVTAKWFGQALKKALNKEVDWDTDVIQVALYTGTLPAGAQDEWVYKSDIATIVEVANGNGYATGGAVLGTKTIGYTTGTNVTKLDGADVTWSASTISATCAIIYVKVGADFTTPEDDVLLGYVDFGGTFASSAGDFKITWHTDGIFTITAG